MNRFMRNLNGFLVGVLIVIALVAVTGCAGAKPYAEISLGYQLDKNSDWYVRTTRDWQCSENVKFAGELGLEFSNKWSLAYHHQSWVLCGGPFGSSKPELYADDIRVTKKFGGAE